MFLLLLPLLRSPHLRQFPQDISGMTGLRCLSVTGSPNSLIELSDGIGALVNLVELKLHGCHMLQVGFIVGSLPAPQQEV